MHIRTVLTVAMLVAAAPDGRLCAAAPGPTGQLFIFEGRNTPGRALAGEADAYFCGADAQHTYRLALGPDAMRLDRLDGPQAHRLAERKGMRWPPTFELAIRRAGRGIVVALDGVALIRTEDAAYAGKNMAARAGAAAVQLKPVRAQRLGPVVFNDNFMRAEVVGQWKPQSGYWELSGMKAATFSPNPFTIFARFPKSPVLAALYEGRTRRYTGIGVRVSYRDGRAHIIAVHPGSPAEAAGLHAGDVIAKIDGETAIGTSRDDIVERILGRPGTTVKLVVRRAFGFRQRDREVVVKRKEIDLDRVDTDLAIQPAHYAKESLATAGHYFWGDYTFEASARFLGGGMGLAFAVRDAQHYWLFEWSDALRLVRVWDGERKVLAERPGAAGAGQHYALKVQIDGEQVAAFVDDAPALRATCPELSWGGIGLWASEGRGVYYDDVRVLDTSRFQPRPRRLTMSSTFANDRYMRKWANPKEDWVRSFGAYWYRYPLPGRVRLSYTPRSPYESFEMEARAQPRKPNSGYTLKVQNRTAKPTDCQATLARGGKVLTSATGLDAGLKWELSLDRGKVLARAGGKAVMEYEDPEPLAGDAVRLAVAAPSRCEVASPDVLDYAFEHMPVDWTLAGGRWGMMNRWICTPKWSWFGGRSKQLAAVWHKCAFEGDIAVDAFFGFEMAAFRRNLGYERPECFGLTICADGGSFASGYTLLMGADGNTVTRLYRKGKVVARASSKAALFDPPRRRQRGDLDVHHDWFLVQLRRRGSKLAITRNGKLALQYDDPDPLPGGKIAFWTINNGILLARTRLAATRVRRPEFEPPRRVEFNDGQWTNVYDGAVAARVAPLDDGYRVTSLGAGPMAVRSLAAPVDAVEQPVLSFDYRVSPGTRIDLYFDLDDVAHRIRLTGPAWDRHDPLAIGEVAGARADGQWHTAEFPLLAALRTHYPDADALQVDRFTFGNFHDTQEGLAGLACNGAGCSYEFRRFKLGARDEAARPEVASVVAPYEGEDKSEAFAFHFRDPSGRGLDASRAWVSVDGRKLRPPAHGWPLSPTGDVLSADLAASGVTLRDGQTIAVEVGGVRSRGGRAMMRPYRIRWRYDRRRDTVAPVVQRIRTKRAPVVFDFESKTAGLRATVRGASAGHRARAAWLGRSTIRPYAGSYSLLALSTRWAYEFGGVIDCSIDAGQYPLMTLHYWLPHTSTAFALSGELGDDRLTLASAGVGSAAWRFAAKDVFAAVLKGRAPTRMVYRLSALRFTSRPKSPTGRPGSADAFYIDDLAFWPVLGRDELDLQWDACDLGGIQARRCSLDRSPATRPTTAQAPATFATVGDGLVYFHVQVQDGAGNWSEVRHQPLLLDLTPPSVRSVEASAGMLVFKFFETRGLDPTSVQVQVGDMAFKVDNDHMWYDQALRELKLRLADRAKRVFAGRPTVGVRMVSAADFARNALVGTRSWRWRKGQAGRLEAE